MAALWICVDLCADGVRVGLGRSGWTGRRLLSSAKVEGPALPDRDFPPYPGAVVGRVEGAVAECALSAGGRPEGILAALPDSWFKIGLVFPREAGGNFRPGEYATWKLRTDWNLEEERIRFDWQRIGGRRESPSPILLVAADHRIVDAIGALGKAADLQVRMCVPRAFAAWNRMSRSLPGGVAASLLRDGNSFTFFGADGKRLRYLRSRRCDSPEERKTEEAETLSHFRESSGGEGAECTTAEWGDGMTVLEGLLEHPLVSGVFA